MARINLLPWREELREEKKKEFGFFVVSAIIAAAAVVFFTVQYFNLSIKNQESRNDYIQSETNRLDGVIGQIRKLKDTRSQLIERMEVITSLQGNRPVIVRVFDQIVRTMPEGSYYLSLKREGQILSLEGLSKASEPVVALMKNLERSEWFKGATTKSMDAEDSKNVGESETLKFSITVSLSQPKAGEEEEIVEEEG